jgi:trehalose 6-phosphate phosphatase
MRLPRQNRPPPPPLPDHCALFLDIDGTLAELADDPRSVRVDADVAAALPRLAQSLDGALALITGRAITDADRLFPQLKLPLAGQHGSERRDAEGIIHLYTPHPGTLDRLRELAQGLAARHTGLLVEDKGATLALHYRRSPHLASHVRRALRSSHDDTGGADGYTLQPGKMLLEVRPENRDKGTAIRDFMAEPPFAGRLPVFLGDDRTDEHGFAAVEAQGGWSIKVGPGRTRAHFRLADIAAVRRWLLAAPGSASRIGPANARCAI